MKTLGGPILIGQLTGQLAQENLAYLLPFMAVISVNLAILNLLPVPILDGGMIIFLLIELVVGKPLSIRKREWAQKVGLFLLFMLMAVVLYNDVVRLLE
jgi:regulator of sigma E protease